MPIDFTPAKDKWNRDNRGFSLSLANDLDWAVSIFAVSKAQNNDTSTRFVAIGPVGRLVYVVVFTIGSKGSRVISMRRASKRESAKWSASQTRS